MADRLRSLWDFDDLDATEDRFSAQLGGDTCGRGDFSTTPSRSHAPMPPAHMCALAVSADCSAMEQWTRRGLDLGEREPDAPYWRDALG
jgi:hypothetical protein